MEPSSPRVPRRASGRSKGASFRVCTTEDFQSDHSRKRKAGHPSTACQRCRVCKLKCSLSESRQQPRATNSLTRLSCTPCKEADVECHWDGIDRRRGKKPRRESSALNVASAEHDGMHNESSPGVQPQEESVPATPRGFVSPPAVSEGHANFTHTTESDINATQYQASSQPLLAELHLDERMELPEDLSDLAELFLGIENLVGSREQDPVQLDAVQSPHQRHPIRLRYYRRFGPTAAVPGLRRLSIFVDQNQDESSISAADVDRSETASRPHVPIGSSPASASTTSTNSRYSRLFDRFSREPHPTIMPQILQVFFDNFGGHFPFLNPQTLSSHVKSGEASSFLLNSIAALTVRFCPLDGLLGAILGEGHGPEWQRGAPFLKKAKEQLVPLLSIPAPDVLAGLLVLAWAEFGDNNEAGLWMFAGMAIRMAQDLGFHRTPDAGMDPNTSFYDNARPSPDGTYVLTKEQSAIHQTKARLVMFWSVFILDVSVSLLTGRPPTIRRAEIEAPIPTANDMKLAQLDFSEMPSMQNIIFPAVANFMLLYSEAVELLNQRSQEQSSQQPNPTSWRRDSNISRIRLELSQCYSSLPPDLAFNIENYKISAGSSQAGLFLTLHLFFYTFMTLLSNTHSRDAIEGLQPANSQQPNMLNPFRDSNHSVRSDTKDPHQSQIDTLACQKTVQLLTIAELVDQNGYLGTPFTSHCFFVAASAILQGVERTLSKGQNPQTEFFALITGTDYEFLSAKLKNQARYFGAVNSITAILERRKRVLIDGVPNEPPTPDEEEDAAGGAERVVIGLEDSGIVNRYTISTF